ncbi:MAG: S8 family serine peptidase [Desulfobacterales bacterium]|nr:S8 family serine peptidase [Desulfobacterales bacterium]
MDGNDPGLTAIPDAGVSHRRCRASRRWLSALVAASLAFLLAACGGGGGGGGSSAAANQAPTAAFTATPTSGNTPLAVAFNAASSTDADGTIATYAWTFGDGASAAGQTTSHTYTTGGTFTASLTVTDDDGATDAASRTITVTNTVSGTVGTSSSMVFDSDVNDPRAPYIQNDTALSAQAIASPATVGGYVNVAGSGNSGRSQNIGDPSDYFEVSMAAGQSVVLYIGDTAAADLDLYLYDDPTDLTPIFVGDSGLDRSLEITTPASQTYWIRVAADSGASTYTLFVGQSITAASNGGLRNDTDFIPGEIIVKFKENEISAMAADDLGTLSEAVGLEAFRGTRSTAVLMGFSDTMGKERAFERLGIHINETDQLAASFATFETQDKLDTLRIVRALRKRSDVASADPNYIRTTTATPNDEYYDFQWHYPLINLPQAWDSAPGGNAVIVAVVDTGVLLAHPDLSGRLTTTGYDFVSSTYRSRDGDGIDADPDDPGDGRTGGSSFHGTHVAGTISAATDNGTTGVAGVAYTRNIKVMPVRVLGKGGGTSYDVMQGVRYAAGLSNDSGTVPAQAAQVINLSLGGSGSSSTEQSLYTQVRNAGIIVVAAAGNSASSSLSYPAAYNGVVSVSAVEFNKDLAPYSNYGTTIDVAAPGGDTTADENGDGNVDGVLSTCGDDTSGTIQMTYKFYQGTSMATPHVAGVTALMKEIYPALTPTAFDALLQNGDLTQDIGTAGRDNQFGYGLIDALKAVSKAKNLLDGTPLPTFLTVEPSALNFGTTMTSLNLATIKSGTGVRSVNNPVTTDVAWLTVAATSVDAERFGTYTATANRGHADLSATGSYSAKITFTTDDAKSVEIPVSLQVTVGTTTSSGYHYVVLVDPDSEDPIAQTAGNTTGGNLNYIVSGVTPGTYKVYAGTDSDNDGIIGGTGEAIGAYLSLEDPNTVTVGNNLSNIDFATQINTSLPAAGTDRATSLFPLIFLKAPIKKIKAAP